MSEDTERFMAMKGAGYYAKATVGARHVIESAIPEIEAALADMALGPEGPPVVFTDMGCADGGTSIGMWGHVLGGLRQRLGARALQLVYTDLPRNDFSQLFQIVHGQTEIDSALPQIDGLYLMASATSFHRPIVPPGTLHLGFSATASHYVSETPAEIPDHVHMVGASGAVRDAYRAQGARDWQAFLLARAQELAPGGHLVLYNFGIDEQGRYLGHTGGVSMFDAFNQHWAALRDAGRITQAEYQATNFPQVYRTVEEFAAPLQDPEDPVYRAGLRLKAIRTTHTPCPFAATYAEGGQSAEDFARAYVPTLRSWSEPSFVNGIQGRPAAEIAQIIDDFYGAYEAAVAADPAGHAMDYIHCAMVCEKV